MKSRFRSASRTLHPGLLPLALALAGWLPLSAQLTNPAPVQPPTSAEERARIRDELQRLSPEERRARLRALRPPSTNAAPPQAASEVQRRQLIERKILDLRQKAAAGQISPPERALLERLERALARRDAARATHNPAQTGGGPETTRTNAPPSNAASSAP